MLMFHWPFHFVLSPLDASKHLIVKHWVKFHSKMAENEEQGFPRWGACWENEVLVSGDWDWEISFLGFEAFIFKAS